ncbi:MAG: hypothetical protein AABN95_21240 [Acidobacteriota bacterium]
MKRQHTENLFRRYKGQVVNIKTISGGVYKGYVGEITDDYVTLSDRETEESTFVLFSAIESVLVVDLPGLD